MNHKRHRPRNRRVGCKLCKPWKVNGYRTQRAGLRWKIDPRLAAAGVTEKDLW